MNTDLMWLNAYKSKLTNLYFASSYKEVKNAKKNSPYYKGSFINNIYKTQNLEKGKTYYWRLDSILNYKRKGMVF